jgi:hypothetical protein
MDTNSNDMETAGSPEDVGIQSRPTDWEAIIHALRAANLPLDGSLGLTLTKIGLVLVHRTGENRWEVAGEVCSHINMHDMGLGDWIYGRRSPAPSAIG